VSQFGDPSTGPTAAHYEYIFVVRHTVHCTSRTILTDPQNGDVGGDNSTDNKFFSILYVLNAPFSRGSVSISSANPSVPPTINPNFLAHPMDLHTLEVANANALKFTSAKAFEGYILSADGDFASGDATKVEAYIRNNAAR
jgi:hypothetical protein